MCRARKTHKVSIIAFTEPLVWLQNFRIIVRLKFFVTKGRSNQANGHENVRG